MNSLIEIYNKIAGNNLYDGKFKIFSDLDGVLADFEKRFLDHTNYTAEDHKNQFGVEKFWADITKHGVKFWSHMEWMPDGKQLWHYIQKYKPILLSAPSREESSREGKKIWVEKHMPGTELLLAYASDKQQYANPEAILIDDRKRNIYEWRDAGGIGIIHTSAITTIEQLKELGL